MTACKKVGGIETFKEIPWLNKQSSVGDLVQCMWCEKVMVVNIGEDVCPACNTEGTLSWIEDCPKEVEG